jgi:hypothetical protein
MQYATAAHPPVVTTWSPSAATWIKLSVVYLIAGVALGIAMGAAQNFTLRPVHAHLNLLGWATVALAGLIYGVFPAAGKSRLATLHFWLHNAAVPVMMASLAMMLLGNASVVPALVASEFVAAGGILVFAFNVFRNVRLDDAKAARTTN